MEPPVPPSPKGLGKKQIPQPEWSKVDPIEDKPIGDNKKLAAYIAKSQAPTPDESAPTMIPAGELAKYAAKSRQDPMPPAANQLEQALRSRGSPRTQAMATNSDGSKVLSEIMQERLAKTTALQEKQARMIEILKNDTNSPLHAVLTDLLVGPSPEDQQEQEAAAEMLAKAYSARLSKKDRSTT